MKPIGPWPRDTSLPAYVQNFIDLAPKAWNCRWHSGVQVLSIITPTGAHSLTACDLSEMPVKLLIKNIANNVIYS